MLILNSNLFLYASERHIAIVIRPEWYGELEFAYKIQKACQNLGWQGDLVDFEKPLGAEYDFALTLVPRAIPNNKIPNYLSIFHTKHHYFDANGYLLPEYRNYTGYLLTYPLNGNKKDFLDTQRFPHMTWFPTSQQTPYVVVNPSKLFYICSFWGNRAEDKKFKGLISYLDAKSYARIFGADKFKPLCPRHFEGRIPVDGESVINTIQDSGVALIMHSDDHIKAKLPSGRIFEAAAASAIIICDKNKFVKKHFGDSVLYVDQKLSAKKFYKAIDKKMQWISKNKSEALEMAKRAHEIFTEKFLLEDQLLNLEKFHQEVTKQP